MSLFLLALSILSYLYMIQKQKERRHLLLKNNIFLGTKPNRENNAEIKKTEIPKRKVKIESIKVGKVNVSARDTVIHDIYDYVKTRIELGILSPIELTDVYGLSVYVGMILPEAIKFDLDGDIMDAQKGDFVIFDFDGNISYVKKSDFNGFYRMSKASKEQQLLSAIRLFKLNMTAEQLSIKETLNESARASEDAIFNELANQIMNGKVDSRLMDIYKRIINSKYKNEVINYTALSGYKAKYFISLLKKNKTPFALLVPLVDSIVDTSEDFDVDKITALNNYITLIATRERDALIVSDCLKRTNLDLEGKAHCVDNLTYEELIAFKAEMDATGISIPGTTADKVLAQVEQEIIEDHALFIDNEVEEKKILNKDLEEEIFK